MAVELRDSNIYANPRGRIIQYTNEIQILERVVVPPKADRTDKYHFFRAADDLMRITYSYYKDVVRETARYWWLIADRNNVFDPFENTRIITDAKDGFVGDVISIEDTEIVITECTHTTTRNLMEKKEFDKCPCGLDLKELKKGNEVCKCKKGKNKKTYTSKLRF